jgi:hypothetical protein
MRRSGEKTRRLRGRKIIRRRGRIKYMFGMKKKKKTMK